LNAPRFPQRFLVIVFLLILGVSAFSPLLPPDDFWQDFQSSTDHFSIRHIFRSAMAFPQAYSSYFNDHYRFRDEQIEAFHALRLWVLKEKEFPNVLIGKEDWLYYTGEDNIRDYECSAPFTKKDLNSLVERVQHWQDRLDEMGIDFYLVIAPNKESIVPQYLPDNIQPGWSACRIDQVMKALIGTSIKVLDLRRPLLAAAEKKQVYHRTDTHWNDSGAMIAAKEILDMIRRENPRIGQIARDQFIAEERDFRGDLARFIPEYARFVERAVFLTPMDGRKAKLTQGEKRKVFSRNPETTLPKAIVFRGSFSDALIPFLAEYFSSGIYVHSFTVDFDLVAQEQPDIVILEVAQRYLGLLR
jgi:alginate O-acetyltransferase complex protein AlgJ